MTKIIISIILIIISTYGIFAYIRPTYNSVDAVLVKIEKYDKALKQAKDIQSKRQALLSQFNLFDKKNREKLRKLLPDDVDSVRLILDIDGIATARGIRIGSVKVQKDKDTSKDVQVGNSVGFDSAATTVQKYKSVILNFTTTAPYEEFKLFMQDLEHSLRIVDLVELNITPINNNVNSSGSITQQTPFYKFDVGIKTYWLK